MVRLSQAVDQFGQPVRGSCPISDYICALDFSAAGVKTMNVPAGANLVRIRATTTVYVNAGTAAAPGADVTDGSSAEAVGGFLGEGLYLLAGVSALSVAATAASIVTLSFYA